MTIPDQCQAGRTFLGETATWRTPCVGPAELYLVTDDDLPAGFTVTTDVHEAVEAWLCTVHMNLFLMRAHAGGGISIRSAGEGVDS